MKRILTLLLLSPVALVSCKSGNDRIDKDTSPFLSYELNPQCQQLAFFLKNGQNENFETFNRLRTELLHENLELVFAMNGGMFTKEYAPVGIYIEEGILLSPLDTTESESGNFYLQPNGVFYLTRDNIPGICTTESFKLTDEINFATQSGPMLLVNDTIHPAFNQGSVNKQIRNGVGILPNGHLLFVLSKTEINFYDFAAFFKQKGCKNALYLDGYVSRAYLPSQNWIQTDEKFGVIIAETALKK